LAMDRPSGFGRCDSVSLLHEGEELEVCCICLDSLSTAPIAALLVEGGSRASCAHFLHACCAERLRTRRCPLCRAAFSAPSASISRQRLAGARPSDVLAGLRRLAGRPAEPVAAWSEGETAGRATARGVVELLAAVLPIRQASLKALLAAELVHDGSGLGEAEAEVDEEALARLLHGLGLCSSDVARSARVGKASSLGRPAGYYSLALSFVRRLRRLLLKAAGATGAALHLAGCGICLGVCVGMLAALPRLRAWDFLRDRDFDLDDWRSTIVVFGMLVLLQLAYRSIRDPRWVKRGCRWGAICGAVVGWAHALATVDPDRHGVRNVFLSGLMGRTAWPEWWGEAVFGWEAHPALSLASAQRFDIFAPSSTAA